MHENLTTRVPKSGLSIDLSSWGLMPAIYACTGFNF